jgi:hypothetical protein
VPAAVPERPGPTAEQLAAEQLAAEHRAGQRLVRIAAARGVDEAMLVGTILAEHQACPTAQVEGGGAGPTPTWP